VTPAGRDRPETRALYRWRDDPREAHDLAAGEPAVVLRLSDAITRTERNLAAHSFGEGPRVTLTDAQVQRLKGLGYTGGDNRGSEDGR